MNENENLAVKVSVQSAAQGLKMAISSLDLVHYLLARVEGDLRVYKLAKDGSLDSLKVAGEEIADAVKTIKGLQTLLLNTRNDVGTYGAARLLEDQANKDAQTTFREILKQATPR